MSQYLMFDPKILLIHSYITTLKQNKKTTFPKWFVFGFKFWISEFQTFARALLEPQLVFFSTCPLRCIQLGASYIGHAYWSQIETRTGWGRMQTLNSFTFGCEFCFQINGHRSPCGHDSDPCFRNTGMWSLSFVFCFFPVWVTQSTLRLPHLFECACELWHLPAFVSVKCVDVFSVLHGAQICLTFQFKNPNYVQER